MYSMQTNNLGDIRTHVSSVWMQRDPKRKEMENKSNENLLGIYRSILIYISRLVEYASVLIRKIMYFWLNTFYFISVKDTEF